MNKITSENRYDAHQAVLPGLSDRRAAVLEIVLGGPPGGLTAENVAAILDVPVYWIRPRLTELLTEGKIAVVGKQCSRVTGRNIALYRPQKVQEDF